MLEPRLVLSGRFARSLPDRARLRARASAGRFPGRAIEQERKARETEELVERIERLERPGPERSNKMATNLETRVCNLEAAGGSEECPECGFDGDWSKVEMVTHVNERVPGPDNCSTCGRPLVIRVTGLGDSR